MGDPAAPTVNIRPGDLSAHGDAIHYLADEYRKPVAAARQAADAVGVDGFELSPIAKKAMALALSDTPKVVAEGVSATQFGVRRYGMAAKAVSKGLSAEDASAAAVISGSIATVPLGAERTGAQLGLNSKVRTDLIHDLDYGRVMTQDDVRRVGPNWMDKLVDMLPGDYMPGLRENGSWLRGAGFIETFAAAMKKVSDPSVSALLVEMRNAWMDFDSLKNPQDIVNSLLTAGIGWIYEHVEPLPTQLDLVFGNGMVAQSHAQTWKNVGWSVWTLGEQVETRLTTDLQDQQSKAVNAYFESFGSGRQAMARLGQNCNRMASAMDDCGTLTNALRDFVRGIFTQMIADIIQYFLRIKGYMRFPGAGGGAEASLRSYARQLASNYGALAEKFIRQAGVAYESLRDTLDSVKSESEDIIRLWSRAFPQLTA